MKDAFFEYMTFNKISLSVEKLLLGEYDNCSFINCNFSNSDISEYSFAECKFENCDFSNAITNNTTFRDTKFINCKLLGLHFENCNPFLLTPEFISCQLNFASFYKLKLKNTRFKDCMLSEVDFTEADFTASIFENCDFSGSVFENTVLEKADFRTSFNFFINPEINKIKKAKFSLNTLGGLLYVFDIVIED